MDFSFLNLIPFFGVFMAGLLALLTTAFWIWMIIDVIKTPTTEWEHEMEKIAWLLVVILVNWIGALIYYFSIKKSKNFYKEGRY
ncbi:PLD nuclease N-terminal domain-containing protein [Proteinivorax tanatarense]|uniref:PLD nuclease N-terminal domain-containing protein n=1 Tax=Proteinivorax tanatarense TaxID=1260629 RepID=A0AAU7VMI0_9FIRM